MDLNLLGLMMLVIGTVCELFFKDGATKRLFAMISGIGFGLIIYPFL